MEALVNQGKSLVLILVYQTTNFAWVYVMMLIIVICLLMEKNSLNLNWKIKVLTFQLNFAQEIERREVFLNGNVYDFSVDYNTTDQSDILNIRKYLMAKIRATLFDLNSVDLNYYPFMISLDKFNGSCNVLSTRICVPKKTKDINVKVFNMITNKNEVKTMTKHIQYYYCNCKFNRTLGLKM